MVHRLSRVQGVGGPLAVAEAAAFLASAPVLMFPNRYSPLALALLPSIWLVRLFARRGSLRRTPADWPLLGLLLMTLVSLYPSVDLALSLPKLYGLVLGVYLFTLISEHLSTALWRRALAVALVLGGVGVALAGFLGTDWKVAKLPVPEALYGRLPRLITEVPTSFGGLEPGFHPNEVGGMLALLLPFALGLTLFSQQRIMRLALGASIIAMLATATLTASRSSLAGIALASLVLVILRWPRLVFSLPPLILGLAGAVWWIGLDRVTGALLAIETATGASVEGRLEVWNRAFYMIRDFALTGIGLNTFPVVANALYPFSRLAAEARVPHAHNLFLQAAVDLGVPGLLSFLWLLVAAGAGLVRAWRGWPGWERGLVAALAAGLLGHLIFGLTDAVTLGAKPGAFFWAMLGAAVALGASGPKALSQPGGGNPALGSGDGTVRTDHGRARPSEGHPAGVGVLHWGLWTFFTLACGLGVVMAVTGIKMWP